MDSSEYELVRNLTLLFFFERLMDKGGPRTLHDLSCQFGAKGFTKEMRQIAGGSQSGLRKFLAQYPTLFVINGDYVSVNTFEPTVEHDAGIKKVNKRDYAKEAVEYFTNKLVQYGVGAEVPIKSLLGHRSQASPEVRHISGQHYREFRDFLLKYSDDFIVCDDNVKLKQFEGMEGVPFKELEPEVPVDQEMTSKLLDFFCQTIKQKGPLCVEQLLSLTAEKLPVKMWTNMFTTPQDLTTFLRMFPDAFNVQKQIVSLHDKIKLPSDIHQKSEPTQIAYKENINSESSGAHHYSHTPKTSISDQILPVDQNPVINRNSDTESAIDSLSSIESNPHSSPVNLQQQTLKQRINTLVMKTLAANTEKDRNLHTPQVGEAWKLKILQKTKIIVNVRECGRIIDEILNPPRLPAGEKIAVSFDCEGINVGSKGQLTLIQIGTMEGNVFIFDLFTSPNLINILRKLLEDPTVIKVIHDCRCDSVNLYNQFGITLKNVFDTQAAHAVIQFQDTGKPVDKVKNVNFNTLCDLYGAPCNLLKNQLKYIYRKDQKYWLRRPMSRDMLIYATSDVLGLVPQAFTAMSKRINPEMQTLFNNLCEEAILTHISPVEIKARKRQRKIETEVIDLRKKMDEATEKNIVLSNREIRLLRYLSLTEDEKVKLKCSYKVAKKLEKLKSLTHDKNESTDDDNDNDNDDDENNDIDDKDDDNDYDEYYEDDDNTDDDYDDDNHNKPNQKSVYTNLDNCIYDNTSYDCSSLRLNPLTLTESMQMVDEILSDENMDRFEKIEKLENILSSVTNFTPDKLSSKTMYSGSEKCSCLCHEISDQRPQEHMIAADVGCQTLSTGDIVITSCYFL
ncbi:egalitarian protein homolog [Microplitis mediator]|uniref:egalitarian protein homolog n=1 Tax=Microplitis mediator TaxID=375433 RepID=UPI00255471A3|nr:egalitarian protein homolog [Microplitis mediator]XP_057330640.1 egalitarian protein homolog [Microplitis mediator]